jgi:hypothetical protein
MITVAIPTVLALLIKEERPIQEEIIKQSCEKVCNIIPNVNIDELCTEIKSILSNPKDVFDAVTTAKKYLQKNTSVTKQQIEEAVDKVITTSDFAGLSRNLISRYIEENYNIRMDDFRIIEAAERRNPWIGNAKANITWSFWNRYRDYLQIEKNYSDTVLNQIDKLTNRTLDCLFNPTEKIIVRKKGLVVGQVQSGKTSNYTGLICKAADTGYKLIIVLAGIHNNLRSQTQLRLDEGFLGFDTQHQRAYNKNGVVIGVGKINQEGVAHSLTSSLEKGDFATKVADSMGGFSFNTAEPIIAVVKKNSKVLERLYTWLSAKAETLPDGSKKIRSKSLLLIDDEADNASINTSKEDDPATKINQHIKNILNLFDRSGYVGYTATPFANIFIPIKEDDLFPRDFIINIPAPSNYIGPEKVFGIKVLEDDDDENDSVLPIVNRVDDYRDSIPNGHKKDDHLPTELPASLKTAIKCFILTCAIRKLRGQEKVHNSMLVHVSRYTRWQKQIKELVENTFSFYRRGIEFNNAQILDEIRKIFEEDHEYNISHAGETITERYKSYKTVSQMILDKMPNVDSQVSVHTWEEVLPHLHSATAKIEVREINGGSGDALNYFDHKDGLSVIAVGGDKLSRGLTLEGLSVSYYLRASRMYDTLMQMGRWFGYRPGYVDLCRLFTSRELNEWFCHITLASEELRSEFEYMSDVAGSTPEQYALRVRTHPGVLQISASNKIRRAVNVDISWAGRLVESYQLQKTPKIVQSNLEATKSLINSLPSSFSTKDNHILWKNISAELVKPFFQNFKVSESLKKVDPLNLLSFIDISNRSGELTNWNIAIRFKKDAEFNYDLNSTNGISQIGCIVRTSDPEKNDNNNLNIRKNHIISPKDEFFDLTEEEYKKGLERTKELNKDYKNDFPKGEIVRNEIRKPTTALLILYFLNPEKAGYSGSEPIVGFAVSFPRSIVNPTVQFAVHEQLLSRFDINDDVENDNTDED